MLKENAIYTTRRFLDPPIAIPLKITKELLKLLQSGQVDMNLEYPTLGTSNSSGTNGSKNANDNQTGIPTLRIGNDKVDLRVIPEAARVECYIPYNNELKLVGTVKDQLVIPPVVKGARLKRIQEEAEKTKSLKSAVLLDVAPAKPREKKLKRIKKLPEIRDLKKVRMEKQDVVVHDLHLKRNLIHYLAVQPRLVQECIQKTKRTSQAVLNVLESISKPQRLNPERYQLNSESYKLLDPFKFPGYTADDRDNAIRNACIAFDQLELPKDAIERQRLISPLSTKVLHRKDPSKRDSATKTPAESSIRKSVTSNDSGSSSAKASPSEVKGKTFETGISPEKASKTASSIKTLKLKFSKKEDINPLEKRDYKPDGSANAATPKQGMKPLLEKNLDSTRKNSEICIQPSNETGFAKEAISGNKAPHKGPVSVGQLKPLNAKFHNESVPTWLHPSVECRSPLTAEHWSKMNLQNLERYCSWIQSRKKHLAFRIEQFLSKKKILTQKLSKSTTEKEKSRLLDMEIGDLGSFVKNLQCRIAEYDTLCTEGRKFEEWVNSRGGTIKLNF